MSDLDSRNKRGSAIGLDTAGNRVFPNPAGAIDSAILRTHVGTKYAFGVGAGGGGGSWLLSPFGLRNRRAAPILLKK